MIRVGQRYGKADLSGPWEAIVVGSGMGGLTAASLLARHGRQRVLVLERHYMPGGFTHAYSRHGWEWDVGVHYIGELGDAADRRRPAVRRFFDHVTDGSLEWASMGEIYDRIVIGERSYDFVSGREAFYAQMTGYFPAQAGAIARYLELLDKVPRKAGLYYAEKAVPPLLSSLFGGLMRRPFLKWASRTTRDVLEELTDDQELIGVLTGQFGDYWLPPGESSCGLHSTVARHYLNGAYYPVGGASSIAAAMAPRIEAAGGLIVYQAEVEEILVRGGPVGKSRAAGVRLAGGEEIEAPLVVSDAGVHTTFQRLLPPEVAEGAGVAARAARTRPSISHLCIYAGFKKTAADLGFAKTNLWLYPGPDHDGNVAAYLADTSRPLPVVYVSFPSAKDPAFETNYPGRATIELITLASFEEFKPWLGTEWRKRGAKYEELKTRYAERMFERLERQAPGIVDQIDYYEISTPLTTRHFANYEAGEIYGLDHSPQRFEQRFLKPRTPIKGLFLTGQDVASCGVVGAMVGGYLAASALLGKNLLGVAAKG